MATGSETPTIANMVYASTAVPMGMTGGDWDVGETMKGVLPQAGQFLRRVTLPAAGFINEVVAEARNEIEGKANMAQLRIVQVFIADMDENIPVEKRVLYQGTPKVTDATDQELFFEISIQELMKAHNEMRVKVINKKVKDRTEYLEPARIRDLKMIVTALASF